MFGDEIIKTFAVVLDLAVFGGFEVAIYDMGIGELVVFEVHHDPFLDIQLREGVNLEA